MLFFLLSLSPNCPVEQRLVAFALLTKSVMLNYFHPTMALPDWSSEEEEEQGMK